MLGGQRQPANFDRPSALQPRMNWARARVELRHFANLPIATVVFCGACAASDGGRRSWAKSMDHAKSFAIDSRIVNASLQLSIGPNGHVIAASGRGLVHRELSVVAAIATAGIHRRNREQWRRRGFSLDL
jgi:hypothetical protein